jgi:rhodanese-related sulfurtransferase
MNRNYIFLTILMLLLAIGTVLIKRNSEPQQIDADELLRELIQPTRYVTTDQVAKMIIKGDPSLMIVDVRSEEEYQEFTLPRALNIPLDSLMTGDNLMNFGIPGTKLVFISNDDIMADQAWVLTKRLGYGSTYVMRGGLNRWMETIIDPQEPGGDEPSVAQETYSFRKGAQMYFTGAGAENSESSNVKVEVRRKEKTVVASGGC